MIKPMKKFPVFFHLMLAAILLVSACALPGSEEEPEIPIEDLETTAESSLEAESASRQLECEIEGYPCTYAETDPQVLEDSFLTLTEAALKVSDETGISGAAEYLQNQENVVEVIYDQTALRFRLKNGPPLWLYNADAIYQNTKMGLGTAPPNQSKKLILNPGLQTGSDDGPIGKSEKGIEPKKKALLLSPYLWDFETDETEVVKLLLGKKNYDCAGCVVVKKNQAKGDQNVTLNDFKNWGDYDLINLSTHGSQVCKQGKCVTSLSTGVYYPFPYLDTITMGPFPDTLGVLESEPGVRYGISASPACQAYRQALNSGELDEEGRASVEKAYQDRNCEFLSNKLWQSVDDNFFRYHYQSGKNPLDDKFIFLNACQSMIDKSLAEIISGDNTTVLGWTESIDAFIASQVAIRFYEHYLDNGLKAEEAFQEANNYAKENFSKDSLRRYQPKGIALESLPPVEFITDGELDTRGREIITLLQPIFRTELNERAAVPTVGAAGDGQPDKLLFLVQIDGISEDQNPEEFLIRLAVDGQDLEDTFRPMEKISEYSYWTVAEVPLPFDAAERKFVELEAWVELPTGGVSRHVVEEVELANCGWNMNLSGGASGDYAGDIVFPTANLTNANAEQLRRLAEEGYLGPSETGAGMPAPEELAGLPDSYLLGSQQGYPFLMVIPGQGLTAMLEEGSLGVGNQIALNLSEDTPERKTGSYSGTYSDLMTQSSISLQGDLIWHADSICSMDVILELIENPFPEGLTP